MQLDKFVYRSIEVLRQFEIGHPVDLPPESACPSIAALVALGIGPSSVPGDVVDLERPANGWAGAVDVDRETVCQHQWMLAHQWADASCLQREQHSEFES